MYMYTTQKKIAARGHEALLSPMPPPPPLPPPPLLSLLLLPEERSAATTQHGCPACPPTQGFYAAPEAKTADGVASFMLCARDSGPPLSMPRSMARTLGRGITG